MCSDGNEIFRQCDCGKTYVTSSYATISGDNLSRLCCGFRVLASMLDNEKDLVSVSFCILKEVGVKNDTGAKALVEVILNGVVDYDIILKGLEDSSIESVDSMLHDGSVFICEVLKDVIQGNLTITNGEYIIRTLADKFNSKNKELHIWLTNNFKGNAVCTNLRDTYIAFEKKLRIINTTQTSFLRTEYFEKGFKIFVHMLDDLVVEIKLGCENKNIFKGIKIEHNLEDWLLENVRGKTIL